MLRTGQASTRGRRIRAKLRDAPEREAGAEAASEGFGSRVSLRIAQPGAMRGYLFKEPGVKVPGGEGPAVLHSNVALPSLQKNRHRRHFPRPEDSSQVLLAQSNSRGALQLLNVAM